MWIVHINFARAYFVSVIIIHVFETRLFIYTYRYMCIHPIPYLCASLYAQECLFCFQVFLSLIIGINFMSILL